MEKFTITGKKRPSTENKEEPPLKQPKTDEHPDEIFKRLLSDFSQIRKSIDFLGVDVVKDKDKCIVLSKKKNFETIYVKEEKRTTIGMVVCFSKLVFVDSYNKRYFIRGCRGTWISKESFIGSDFELKRVGQSSWNFYKNKKKKTYYEIKIKPNSPKESGRKIFVPKNNDLVVFKLGDDEIGIARTTALEIPFLRPLLEGKFQEIKTKDNKYIIEKNGKEFLTIDSIKILVRSIETGVAIDKVMSNIFEEMLSKKLVDQFFKKYSGTVHLYVLNVGQKTRSTTGKQFGVIFVSSEHVYVYLKESQVEIPRSSIRVCKDIRTRIDLDGIFQIDFGNEFIMYKGKSKYKPLLSHTKQK